MRLASLRNKQSLLMRLLMETNRHTKVYYILPFFRGDRLTSGRLNNISVKPRYAFFLHAAPASELLVLNRFTCRPYTLVESGT